MSRSSSVPAGIRLVEAGDGPVLLCLHGIGSSAESFRHQLTGLAGSAHVVAWDAPGYGGSADPETPPGLDGYADAAAEVLAGLGDRPAYVLGASWGGVIAARLALRRPDLVRALVLAGASRGSGRTPEAADAMRSRAAGLTEAGPAAFAAERAPALVSPAASEDLKREVTQIMATAVRLPGYGYAAAAMAETDLSGELPAVGVPTLVLCGADDGVTGPPESGRIADAIPDSVMVTIDGAGHSVNQERPGSFNAWVSSYIDIIEHLYH